MDDLVPTHHLHCSFGLPGLVMLSHQLEGLALRICSLLALSEHLMLLEPDSFDFELVIMEVNREN